MMTSREMTTTDGEFRVVAPIGTPDEARADFAAYQQLVAAILEPSDYQEFRERGRIRRFKKKSAWRKLAVRFNLSVTALDVVIGHKHNKETCARILIPGEKECGCPTQYSRVTVRVTHSPTGRFSDGLGICALGEDRRFSKPDHEIPSTAYTRAVNRAISDMIGAGEDSAEEVTSRPSRDLPISEHLSADDKFELSRLYKAAAPDRQGTALTLMKDRVRLSEDAPIRDTFVTFAAKATLEQFNEVIRVLLGPEAEFDPDSVLVDELVTDEQ